MRKTHHELMLERAWRPRPPPFLPRVYQREIDGDTYTVAPRWPIGWQYGSQLDGTYKGPFKTRLAAAAAAEKAALKRAARSEP